MRVSLLGPVHAHVGDRVVDLGAAKQRAVFALLAMSAGRVVPMDRLIDDLWHDEPPARATMTLRAYISRLRRALEQADGAELGTVPVIRTEPPGWVLTLDPTDVDLSVFLAHVEQARSLVQSGEGDGPEVLRDVCAELEAALALWRGALLADLHALEVARTEAARVSDVRLGATELLLETRLRLGEHELVVDEARSFVSENPFRERGWACLVLALYRDGRQADALAAVAELRTLLDDELGLDPSPQIQELESRVLRQDPGLLLGAPRHPEAATPSESLSPGSTRGVAAVFGPAPGSWTVVGAEGSLRLIETVLEEAHLGRGRLLLFEGEAGAGKSTLLAELGRRAEAAGGHVVRGAGGGAGAMPALWSWVTVVRALSAMETTLTKTGDVATAITLMGSAGDAADVSRDLVLSRTALFRGVIELLDAAHRNVPLVVVIDDLQWVDEETLTLLTLAAAELAPHGVVFAGALRTDEVATERVMDVLGRSPREWLLRHRLAPLDPPGVTALSERIVGGEVDSGVVAAVHAATAGNPLFVSELVTLLAAERRLDVDSVLTTVPDRVNEVLHRRLARLPAGAVSLMQIAAVGRLPVELDALAAVAGVDADDALDATEPAVIAGLLVERGAGFTPSHDLVRQTLLMELTQARRTRLHARLAAVLQTRGGLGPELVLEVAHHLREAAPAVGRGAAIPYLLAASEDAMSRYANLTAGRILEAALELVEHVEDPVMRATDEHRVRGRLVMVQGYTAIDPGAPPRRDALPLPEDATSAMAWVGTMTMTAAGGEFSWVNRTAAQVRSEPLPPVGLLVSNLVVGTTSFALGDLETSRAAHLHCLELCDQGAHHGLTGVFSSMPDVAHAHLALIDHLCGEDQAADDRLRSRLPGMNPNGEVNLALFAALLAAARGRADDALAVADRMIRLAKDLEYRVFAVHGRILRAWAEAMRSDRANPEPIRTAIDDYHSGGLVIFESTYQLLMAEVRHRAGDPTGVRLAVEDSRSLTRTTGEVPLGRRLDDLAERVLAAHE